MVYPANLALASNVLTWDYINDPTTFAYSISAVTNDGATTERRDILAFTSPYDFSANGHTLQDGDVGVRGAFPDSDYAYVVNGTSDGYALDNGWNGSGSTHDTAPEVPDNRAEEARRFMQRCLLR